MSAFVPSKDDLFYVSCKPRKTIVNRGVFSDVAEVVEMQDNSYSGDVFKCIGRDDHALVAKKMRGHAYIDAYTFVRSQYHFYPVGPEIMQALGLDVGGTT